MAQGINSFAVIEAHYLSARIDNQEKVRNHLLKNEVDISPLVRAILDDDQDRVKAVLDANQEGVNDALNVALDYTPLILACGYKQVDSVMHLVQAGAELNQTMTSNNLSPLIVAIQSGEVELVRYVSEEMGAVVSTKPPSNGDRSLSPVHVACFFGHLEVVKYLVETYELEVKLKDGWGVTPLILSLKKNQWEIAEYLLNAFGSSDDPSIYVSKLDLNHKFVHGATALTICMRKFREATVDKGTLLNLARRMLQCGADPLIACVSPGLPPESALSLAVENADYEFVEYAVEKCAPPAAGHEFSAAAFALKVALPMEMKFVKLLLRKLHVNPNWGWNHNGDSCMHELGKLVATRAWPDEDYEQEMVLLFLNHQGDVNEKNKSNQTFLSLIHKRHDVIAFIAARDGPRRTDSNNNNRSPSTNKKRASKSHSDLKATTPHSNQSKRSGNKSSRKKSKTNAASHPRPSSATSSKRRKQKKKKQQQRAQATADKENKEEAKEKEPPTATSSSDLTTTIGDVTLSDLSADLTSGPDQSETDTVGGSSAMEDSDGFRKVETRSARNKKSKKQQKQQELLRQQQQSRAANKAKQKRRNEMASPSPRVSRPKVATGVSQPTSKQSREKQGTSVSLPRRLSGKGQTPPQQVRRVLRSERDWSVNEKNKPVRAHATSWSVGKASQALKSKINGKPEVVNEPRETPKRASDKDDEIPEPVIPPRLLSPREQPSPGTRTPTRGRSPSVGMVDLNAGSSGDVPTILGDLPMSSIRLNPEEEKSPSEKPGIVLGKRPAPVQTPSQPARPAVARPIKPPKFAGSSAVSLDSPASFPRSSPSTQRPSTIVISPTKTHAVTFMPDVQQQLQQQHQQTETPHLMASSEAEILGTIPTDHSSKSGHSTENVDSGNSSPASQSVSIAIQTDVSPVTKTSVDVGFSNDHSTSTPSQTAEIVDLQPQLGQQQPLQSLQPPQQHHQLQPNPFVQPPQMTDMNTQSLTPSSAHSPSNGLVNGFQPHQFDPSQTQALPNQPILPAGLPNVAVPPLGFPMLGPGLFPHSNFGGLSLQPQLNLPLFTNTLPQGPPLQPIPGLPQIPPQHGMPPGQQNQLPMFQYQFPFQMPPSGMVPHGQPQPHLHQAQQHQQQHQQLPLQPPPQHPQHPPVFAQHPPVQSMHHHQHFLPQNGQGNMMQFPQRMQPPQQHQLGMHPTQQRH